MVETIPDAAVFKSALLLACRAPSVYNSQPWRWVAEGGVLHLFVDPRRIAPRSDPSGREAIISCGAVLGHLRVAMAAAGWNANVDRFPNPSNLDQPRGIHHQRPVRPCRRDSSTRNRSASVRRAHALGFV